MYQAELAFCTCKKLESSQMDTVLKGDFENVEGRLEVGEGKESEKWFHSKYGSELARIGGKLIHANAIKTLRFDESLCIGEDTVFMYFLICQRIRMVYYQIEWYYYRIHSKSALHSDRKGIYEEYFKAFQIIVDAEYQRGHYGKAIDWEGRLWKSMRSMFLSLKSTENEAEIRALKRMMVTEAKRRMLRKI